jgi:hypothetical protein
VEQRHNGNAADLGAREFNLSWAYTRGSAPTSSTRDMPSLWGREMAWQEPDVNRERLSYPHRVRGFPWGLSALLLSRLAKISE